MEETRIRIKRNGWQIELRTEKPWTEVMDRCQRDFGGAHWIGGPEVTALQAETKSGPRLRGARGVVSKPRQLPHNSPAGVNPIAEGDTVTNPYLMGISE